MKRGRGRPKGSKNKPKPPQEIHPAEIRGVGRPKGRKSTTSLDLRTIGDEKVMAFVAYHAELLKMREGVNKRDVADLYQRFYRYLAYCAEKGVMPGNMNAYLAIGVSKQDISDWRLGQLGTPEHKKFAEDVSAFFASIHEQAGASGVVNPILSIYWSKAYDGLTDQPKLEVEVKDSLGERRSAEDIAKAYGEVVLPD